MIWDRIPMEKRGHVYNDLYDYLLKHYGLLLPEPKGLRGDSEPIPPVINAPLYEEEHEMMLGAEVRKAPHSPRRVE